MQVSSPAVFDSGMHDTHPRFPAGTLNGGELVLGVPVEPGRFDLGVLGGGDPVFRSEVGPDVVLEGTPTRCGPFHLHPHIQMPAAAGVPGTASAADPVLREVVAVPEANVPAHETRRAGRPARDRNRLEGDPPEAAVRARRSETGQRRRRLRNRRLRSTDSSFTARPVRECTSSRSFVGPAGEPVQVLRREALALAPEDLEPDLPLVVAGEVDIPCSRSQPRNVSVGHAHPQGALTLGSLDRLSVCGAIACSVAGNACGDQALRAPSVPGMPAGALRRARTIPSSTDAPCVYGNSSPSVCSGYRPGGLRFQRLPSPGHPA